LAGRKIDLAAEFIQRGNLNVLLTRALLKTGLATGLILTSGMTTVLISQTQPLPASAETAAVGLTVVYPPNNHQTTASQIFLIGTAPPQAVVTVNGQRISNRSPGGHFAPSLPLQVGNNTFLIQSQGKTLTLHLQRQNSQIAPPTSLGFAPNSLTPSVDSARQPQEPICFSAIAPTQAEVTVRLGDLQLSLQPQTSQVQLPTNAAALTNSNQPQSITSPGLYRGCTTFTPPGLLGQPMYELRLNGETKRQRAAGTLEILSPKQLQSIEVVRALGGVARTGPSSDYSRLTPLPVGTRANVTGREGEWLRLDYGAWIRQNETQPLPGSTPIETVIRSLRIRRLAGWTDVIFPLQTPVPVTLDQTDRELRLTLHNTTAQTDVIPLSDDPVIRRLDWQQVAPGQVQYRFQLKSAQQWGYKLRYEGTSLVLSLRHPPQLTDRRRPLAGVKIVLDPGHGGPEDSGARGPTGLPEKTVTLAVSQLLRQELQRRGATVIMTRTEDVDLDLQPRVDVINREEPTLALSVHYNALPDNGDALRTQGVGIFWYQSQSHDLAMYLHNYLVNRLRRPSYGVFWNNLALTRPNVAPTVLLELGFMINPNEFEWIANSRAQQQLATTLADGVTSWVQSRSQ
jgi:N-acetylmuramoyl-L-alanine amidase